MSPALVLAVLLSAAGYPPDTTFEKTFPPGVSQVRVAGNHLILPILVPREVSVKRKVTVTENGKKVEKVVEEKQPTFELVERKHPLGKLRAAYVSGKAIPARELPKLLAGNTVVLLTYAPVSKTWLAIYKPDTILVTLLPPDPVNTLPPPKPDR
jgi:hypothetical protein